MNAHKFRQMLIERKLSQSDLARLINVHRNHIHLMATGKVHEVSVKHIRSIAKALQLSPKKIVEIFIEEENDKGE